MARSRAILPLLQQPQQLLVSSLWVEDVWVWLDISVPDSKVNPTLWNKNSIKSKMDGEYSPVRIVLDPDQGFLEHPCKVDSKLNGNLRLGQDFVIQTLRPRAILTLKMHHTREYSLRRLYKSLAKPEQGINSEVNGCSWLRREMNRPQKTTTSLIWRLEENDTVLLASFKSEGLSTENVPTIIFVPRREPELDERASYLLQAFLWLKNNGPPAAYTAIIAPKVTLARQYTNSSEENELVIDCPNVVEDEIKRYSFHQACTVFWLQQCQGHCPF